MCRVLHVLYRLPNSQGWAFLFCDVVGGAHQLLRPLMDALQRYVFSAAKLHADDTPIDVLAPGNGKTKKGRLWVYTRDDRPAGDTAAPAVWFRYSPDRKGIHPQAHLKDYAGVHRPMRMQATTRSTNLVMYLRPPVGRMPDESFTISTSYNQHRSRPMCWHRSQIYTKSKPVSEAARPNEGEKSDKSTQNRLLRHSTGGSMSSCRPCRVNP